MVVFPIPRWPGKNVPVRDPPLFQRIQQRPRHVLLPRHIGKFLRAILPSQDLISHRLLIVSRRPWASLS